jgi:anthranilate phosphoribosyltransferase
MDIITNFAASEEAVGAILVAIRTRGSTRKRISWASSKRNIRKKKKNQ